VKNFPSECILGSVYIALFGSDIKIGYDSNRASLERHSQLIPNRPMDNLSFLCRCLKIMLLSSVCLSFSCTLSMGKEQIILQSMTAKLDRLPPRKLLQGSVGQSVVVNVKEHPTNVLGFSQKGASYPKTVTYVKPNSLAWLGGLQTGDQILEEHVVSPLAGIILKRGAKKYFCVLNMRELPADKTATTRLSGNAERTSAQTLASRSIVMMVDASASMGTLDCPHNQSRWQWCREHIRDMYRESNGLLEKNISIVTFDSNFRSYRNCSPSKLGEVFESVTPSGETNMAPALEEAFSLVRSQLERGQPALISLVSDGRPTDVEDVKKSIISEVNRLAHPELLSIVFIEVGTPEHYLRELDNDLVKQGAAKDVVTVIPFGSVNSQSLAITLASAVPKSDDRSNASLTGSAKSENEAKKALDSHVVTPATQETKPVAHTPTPVTPKPPVKAHPTGTTASGEKVIVKPPVVEVDERESVLKHGANRTY